MEMKILVSTIILLAICKTYSSAYQSGVSTFHVGSSMLTKNNPYCPCEEVNSTFQRTCGVSPKVSGINITENGTHFGEFPWQVAIIEKYEEEFVCSGVLVSPRIVLTAAHCIQEIPVSQIKVRLGEWDILSEDKNPFETYASVDIPVSKKYLNTESRTLNEAYNLGILKLNIAVNFDEYPHIAPICLPQITPGKTNFSDCLVTGWIESSVQPLEKQMETYLGTSQSQAMGIWKQPFTSAPSDQETAHCQVSDGNLQDSNDCSPESLSGVMGFQDRQEEEYLFYEEDINANEEARDRVFSRILSKSSVTVLSRMECLKALKELNSTLPKSNQLCVAAKKGFLPCLGDIGSPVICRVVEEKKKNPKEMKRNDINSKYAVVGIITQSHSCIGDDSGMDLHPLLATSISKSLDQICHVITTN
ncbi:uncharacterized protein [Hetaerina americana]|uniref:uncharacterized protein n=1 Tax=Hetaerina americana TaxID=62018 RepID=UPI003A7F3425